MRSTSLAVALLLACALPLCAAERAGVTPLDKRVDAGIKKALEFLKTQQNRDGSWGSNNPAVTGLTVMAFLSAGHTPSEGPYSEIVKKGIRSVLNHQKSNGLIATIATYEMYQHGICTLMLAEVVGMTDDREFANEIRSRLVKAIGVILKAQRKDNAGPNAGGWRYRVYGSDADISVTGWQLMALRAAKNVGCDVPAERIDEAVKYILRCREPNSGGFGYTAGGGLTIPCTGTSILGLEICGKNFHRARESLKAADYLQSNPMRWGDRHFFYGVYYCSQAMFQLGGNYWEDYKPKLFKTLLDNQRDNGSWIGSDGVGPSYSTAMGILALTVEYRFLPIYQRNEGRKKGE